MQAQCHGFNLKEIFKKMYKVGRILCGVLKF